MQGELILDSNSLRSLYHRSIASKPISHHSTHFSISSHSLLLSCLTSTLDSTNNVVRSIILLHDAIKIDRIRTHALPHDVLAYFTVLRFIHTHILYAWIHLPQLVIP